MDEKITNDSALESQCVELFTNLGWNVERGGNTEGEIFRPDITLSYQGHTYGYVGIMGNMDIDMLKEKKKRIASFLETEKPTLFVLTNGGSFDIFYNGKYATTQTIPPSPEGIYTMRRLMAYYEKIQEIMKKHE